ncbi:MAG: PadR family transcriptional regulator [Proteobacteria bacterium]|nr:PadR family transcriptional regulator [Pseudomonadota bacterium]
MAQSDKQLGNLAHQVLGVLLREPRSGYDIVKQIQNFRPAKTSQVYPTLARLQDMGFVTSTLVTQSARPDKRVYEVTEAGRAHLSTWIGSEPEPPFARDDFLTMVYSAWIKSPEEVLPMFARRLAFQEEAIGKLTRDLARVLSDHPDKCEDPADWQFYRAVLTRRRIAVLREDAVWTKAMIDRLGRHVPDAERG